MRRGDFWVSRLEALGLSSVKKLVWNRYSFPVGPQISLGKPLGWLGREIWVGPRGARENTGNPFLNSVFGKVFQVADFKCLFHCLVFKKVFSACEFQMACFLKSDFQKRRVSRTVHGAGTGSGFR